MAYNAGAIGLGTVLGHVPRKKRKPAPPARPTYGLLEQQLLANVTSRPPMVQVPDALRPLSQGQIQSQVKSYLSDLLASAKSGYSSSLGLPGAGSYTMGPGGPQAVPGTELTPAQQMQAAYQGTQGQGANEYTKRLDDSVQWLQGEIGKQPELAWKMAQDLGHDNVTKAKAMVGILKGNQGYILDWIRMQNTVLNQKGQRDLSAGRLDVSRKQFGLNVFKANETVRQHALSQANADRSYAQQVRVHKDSLAQHEADNRRPSATLSNLYHVIVDQHGDPIPDANGEPIPVKGTTSSRSPYQSSVKTAVGLAREGAKMVKNKTTDEWGIPIPGAIPSSPASTYEETVQRIVAAISPAMKEAGYGTAVIWSIAQKQANAWYPAKYRPVRKGRATSKIPKSGVPFGQSFDPFSR